VSYSFNKNFKLLSFFNLLVISFHSTLRNPATYSNQPIINDDTGNHKLLRTISSNNSKEFSNINLLRTSNSSSNLRDASSSSPSSSDSLLRSNSTSNLRENIGNVGGNNKFATNHSNFHHQ